MIDRIFSLFISEWTELYAKWVDFIGVGVAFILTFVLLYKFKDKLPRDLGRDFAHDGKLSAGKPRGAGMLFIVAFIICAVLFSYFTVEHMIYLALVGASMLTGYLDDCSEKPWSEYKKGALDLLIAVITAVTYIRCNGTVINLPIFGIQTELHPVLFGALAVVLIWASINVTNCADGVDALSGVLSLITLSTIVLIYSICDTGTGMGYMTLLLCACIVAYIWYNATPSIMIMGDAGSRAIGFFIAVAVLKTEAPLIYIPVALVLILDGGLSIMKISLKRFLKISILKNVRTPIHDHVRKNMGWSNEQVVFRFAIIQAVLGTAVLYALK